MRYANPAAALQRTAEPQVDVNKSDNEGKEGAGAEQEESDAEQAPGDGSAQPMGKPKSKKFDSITVAQC